MAVNLLKLCKTLSYSGEVAAKDFGAGVGVIHGRSQEFGPGEGGNLSILYQIRFWGLIQYMEL